MDFKKKQSTLIDKLPLLVLIFIPYLVLLTFLKKPELILVENNDLSSYVEPLFSFFKEAIIKNKSVPLWQNKFLSGYPLLGDPQSIIMYPFNYLALLINLPNFFVMYFLIHLIIAAISTYWLGKKIFQLSNWASCLAGLLYSISPKMIAHLKAGHTNLLASYSYIPLVLLIFVLLLKKPSLRKSILLGLLVFLVYVLYLTTFYYLLIILVGYFFYDTFRHNKKYFFNRLFYILASTFFFLGFSLPQLLASLELWPQVARHLLTYSDIAGSSFAWRQYFGFIFDPRTIKQTQTEMVLYVGVLTSILSLAGWLSRKNKKFFLTIFVIGFLYAIGPKTAFYPIFYHFFPGVNLFRVPSRMWFIITLQVSLLAGAGFDWLLKKKHKLIAIILLSASLSELVFLANLQLEKLSVISNSSLPNSLYLDYFKKNEDYFRIYCPSSCPSFTQIKDYQIGYSVGYNPVQLTNYFSFIQKAGGYQFASYAPILPPYQTFVDQPQPVAEKLGILGVRFIISKYALSDVNFKLENQTNGLYLYRNLLEKPRIYIITTEGIKKITPYKDIPGRVEIENVENEGQVILNEVFARGWQVYIDGNKQKSEEYDDIVLSAKVNRENKKIIFAYEPLGIPFTWYILLITFLVSLIVVIRKKTI